MHAVDVDLCVPGCSLQELWFHLPSCFTSDLLLDESYKNYLWTQLQACCTQGDPPPLALFKLPDPRSPPPLSPAEGEEGFEMEYVHPHTYRLVSEEGVRGSCVSYAEREDVTSNILEGGLNLDQVQHR